MKKIATLLMLALVGVTVAQTLDRMAQRVPSPAEKTAVQAQKLINKNPKDFEAYNALALALSRRARETSDVSYYTQAEATLQKSFAIAPDNFDGARTHVWLLLGKHEFSAALE